MNPLPQSISVTIPPIDRTTDALRDACTCPITLELMRDPVIAADNHTYERAAITQHIRNARPGQARSPKTRELLADGVLRVNYAIRSIIGGLPDGQLEPLREQGRNEDVFDRPLGGCDISPAVYTRAAEGRAMLQSLATPGFVTDEWRRERRALYNLDMEGHSPEEIAQLTNLTHSTAFLLGRALYITPIPADCAARLGIGAGSSPEQFAMTMAVMMRCSVEATYRYYGIETSGTMLPTYQQICDDPCLWLTHLDAHRSIMREKILRSEQPPEGPPLAEVSFSMATGPGSRPDTTRMGLHLSLDADADGDDEVSYVPLVLVEADGPPDTVDLASDPLVNVLQERGIPPTFGQRGRLPFHQAESHLEYVEGPVPPDQELEY